MAVWDHDLIVDVTFFASYKAFCTQLRGGK
jgi:hypothetical protein